MKDPTYDIFVKSWGFKDAKYDISMSHMRLMIGQKVTELKNGNQGNQATKQLGNLFIFFFTKINVKNRQLEQPRQPEQLWQPC